MNKFRFTINALAIAIFTLAFASLAQAQATRTWVSGVGDDVNPCSRTAPCKTFAGAISKTAVNGEIDCLDPGGFGAVTITKGITIDGTTGSGFGSILATSVNGIVISDSGSVTNDLKKVIIRNLSINGTGGSNGAASGGLVGIKILAVGVATTVSIENCRIFGFTGSPGDGISDNRNVANSILNVSDCYIENNGRHGIAIFPLSGTSGVKASIDRTTSTNNGQAGFVVSNGGRAVISNCVATGHPNNAGFEVDGSSSVDFETCVSWNNQSGIAVVTGATARLSNCNVGQNTTGVSNSGSTVRSFGNNKIDSNATNVVGTILGPGTGGPSQQ
jgi:Right handed beta helix region